MLGIVVLLFGLGCPTPVISAEDIHLFGDLSCIRDNYMLAKTHYEFCRDQRLMRLSPWLPWLELEAEAGWVFVCWDLLDDALCGSWLPGADIAALGNLRDRLGWRDYYAGKMPTPERWHEGFVH